MIIRISSSSPQDQDQDVGRGSLTEKEAAGFKQGTVYVSENQCVVRATSRYALILTFRKGPGIGRESLVMAKE